MTKRQTGQDLDQRRVDGHKRLLVGYDQQPASQQALLVAASLAQVLDAHLTVMHVVNLEDYPIDPDRADWEEAAEKQVALDQAHATSALQGTPIKWTYQTVRDSPARALAKAASDLDVLFIIVGASGRNIIKRLTYGSVPQALVSHQPRPVLVVPGIPRAD